MLLFFSRKLNCREVSAAASWDDLEKKTRIPLKLWTETAELLLSGKPFPTLTYFDMIIESWVPVFYEEI